MTTSPAAPCRLLLRRPGSRGLRVRNCPRPISPSPSPRSSLTRSVRTPVLLDTRSPTPSRPLPGLEFPGTTRDESHPGKKDPTSPGTPKTPKTGPAVCGGPPRGRVSKVNKETFKVKQTRSTTNPENSGPESRPSSLSFDLET